MIAIVQAGEVYPDGARDPGAGDWGSDGGSSREVTKAGGGYGECGRAVSKLLSFPWIVMTSEHLMPM